MQAADVVGSISLPSPAGRGRRISRPLPSGRGRGGARVHSGLVFALSLLLYLGAATLLVFGAHVVAADALSRVANAYYTVASRDPHLAAIGFVWNPLPSLL